MGVVNLFADMTYEGGASINGQFLGSLGASAATVSMIAGAGECLGYGLRSGRIRCRQNRNWFITSPATPLICLQSSPWPWRRVAGCRGTDARRANWTCVPETDRRAMLSYSTGQHGRGWVYAVNTAMDETGATLGPLLVALALYVGLEFRTAYGLLLISSLLALTALAVARATFPVPRS